MVKYAVLVSVLWTLCVSEAQEVQQIDCLKKVKLGQTVVMKCQIKSSRSYRVWYKLDRNRNLHLMASTHLVIEDNPRILMQSSPNETNLTVKNMSTDDVGTYYCGIMDSNDVAFGSGTVLELDQDSEPLQSVVQTPDLIRVKSGDSVTLSCSFNTSHREPELTSVTWVLSAASHIISWNSVNQSSCHRANTGGTSCVQHMTLNEVSSAHDGTYLCVVTVCGLTQIGNGTRIQVDGGVPSVLNPALMALMVLNVVLVAAVVVLVRLVCIYRRTQLTGRESSRGSSQAEDEVTYAGVNVVPASASCRSTSVTAREAVLYSEVRSRQDRS